jgi:hypothetical protein
MVSIKIMCNVLVLNQLSSLRFCYCTPNVLVKGFFSASKYYALTFYVDIICAPYAKKYY